MCKSGTENIIILLYSNSIHNPLSLYITRTLSLSPTVMSGCCDEVSGCAVFAHCDLLLRGYHIIGFSLNFVPVFFYTQYYM